MVSGGGTNLQAILDARGRGEIRNAEIALVVCGRESAYALTRAKNAGIPTAVVRRRREEAPEEYGERLLSVLRDSGVGFVVLAGFLTILPGNVIRAYPRRIINIHPSLIPSFCGKGYYGLRVHEAALARGVRVTGATVHYVNEIPDGGEIIAQKAVRVSPGDTPESLQRRVMEEAEWVLLPRALEDAAKQLEEEII